MASRKRAPLVHRASNVELLDWRGASKQLAEATVDEEVDRMIVLVSELIPADIDLEVVLKLLVVKTAKRTLSEAARSRVMLLAGQADPHCPYLFPLIRNLVRTGTGDGGALAWDKSCVDVPQLLVYEMTAWDSISDGQDKKRKIGETLLRLGKESRFPLELGLSLGRSVAGTCLISRLIESLNDPTKLLSVLSSLRANRASLDTPGRLVAAGLLLNTCVWSCMLGGNSEAAKAAAETASVLTLNPTVVNQGQLVLSILGMRVSDPAAQSRLTQVTAAVKIGDSVAHLSLEPESRHEIALVCQQLAHCASSPVFQVVFASYALHCVKFSDAIKRKSVDFNGLGNEGFLSLLVSESPDRLLGSLVPSVPPLQRLWIALESCRLASEGFVAIGYIPGASWLLHKGLEFVSLLSQDCRRLAARYTTLFTQKLSEIHIESPTAIRDDTLNYDLLGAAEYSEISLTETCGGVGERLTGLATIVECGHRLHQGGSLHLKRIQTVRQILAPRDESHSSTVVLGEQSIGFEVRGTALSLRIGDCVFPVCHDVVATVLPIVKQFDDLHRANKQCISERLAEAEPDATKEFWLQRKAFDTELGELIVKLEEVLIPSGALRLIAGFRPGFVTWLTLPDILTALPVEAMPCLASLACVRSVPRMPQPDSSPRLIRERRFVVNPNGDCKTTESTILPVLHKRGWQGTSGSPTLSDKDFVTLLSDSDVFLFSGHGGGEKHWSGSSVQRLRVQASRGTKSVAVLMGCSSAKPYGDHRAVFCTPFHYLVGGFRVVVGTLWDVLGRELDRMTLSMLDEMHSVASASELEGRMPEIVHSAKKAAKLKNLSSASMVVYATVPSFP